MIYNPITKGRWYLYPFKQYEYHYLTTTTTDD